MGFIRLDRKFFNNAYWTVQRTFSQSEAWLDLIQGSRFEEGPITKVLPNGRQITIRRGEIHASVRFLGKRWGWGVEKTNKFLLRHIEKHEIERRTEQGETILKLCNYELYNPLSNTGQHSDPNTDRTPTSTPASTNNKKDKKVKKSKEVNISSAPEKLSDAACGHEGTDFLITRKKRKLSGKRYETFLVFWGKFNYKKGKAEAADAWLDIPQFTNTICEAIFHAAEREAKRRLQLEASGKTPKMAQGWLTGRRWEDEIYKMEINEFSETNRENYVRKSAIPNNYEAMQGIIGRIESTQ